MKIGFFPIDESQSDYIVQTKKIISEIGELNALPGIKETILNPLKINRMSLDAIISSWSENIIANKDGDISITGVLAFFIYLTINRLSTKNFILIRHNNFPHHLKTKHRKLVKLIFSLSEKIPHKIVTHSGHNVNCGYNYIPFPLPEKINNCNKKTNTSNYYFLFGRILPYKKIKELIELISNDIHIIIAGSAPDKIYLDECYETAKKLNKKITFIPEFISDEEAASYAQNSLGIIVANCDEDMVVSANHFYSLCMGVRLYTITTPFIEWLTLEINPGGINHKKNIAELALELSNNQNLEKPNCEIIEKNFSRQMVKISWEKILGKTNEACV